MPRSQVRTTPEAIKDYFRAFLGFKPRGVINESHVQLHGPTLAAHYGIYTFTLTNDDGTTKTVGARFSFTYRKEGGSWLIVDHHSSALPEITVCQVGGQDDQAAWLVLPSSRPAVCCHLEPLALLRCPRAGAPAAPGRLKPLDSRPCLILLPSPLHCWRLARRSWPRRMRSAGCSPFGTAPWPR